MRSADSNINIYVNKAWAVIDKISIIWKANLADEIKRDFFRAVTVSVLLYICTTRTQTSKS